VIVIAFLLFLILLAILDDPQSEDSMRKPRWWFMFVFTSAVFAVFHYIATLFRH